MIQKKHIKPEMGQFSRQRTGWPVVEGIGALASMLGVPESFIKKVKRDGSKAFLTHNRIDTGILMPELFAAMQNASDLPDGFASWKELLESEKAKREAIKRTVEEKSVIPSSEAVRQAGQAMGYTFAELERRDRELPPVIAGLSAVEIFKKMSADTEAIRKTLKMKFEEIGQ